jgi:chorismate dehydratase
VSKLRLGIADLLEARPLAWGFLKGHHSDLFEPALYPPGRVASLLAEGELDVGLIPSIEIARVPDLRVVPDLCLGVDGPSETALLLLERAVEEVKRVAVDRHSRSAVALLKIVLLEVFGREVEAVPQQQRVSAIPADCDGALLLAEAALKASWEGSRHVHLTGYWQELTGGSGRCAQGSTCPIWSSTSRAVCATA